MQDVAKLAGVSPMTVSRVINRDARVSEKTRTRVTAAIAELNYVPNQAARRLTGQHTFRIGLLYIHPVASFLTEFMVGLLSHSSHDNVQLVVEKCLGEEHSLLHAKRLIANGVDGIILPPPLGDSTELLALIAQSGLPAATVACGEPDARFCGVSIDDFQAAHAMTSHLISLGHQRIGFILGNPHQTASALRLKGFRAAIEDHHLPQADELITQGMFTYRSGLDAAEHLLGLAQRPTAVFASNDDMAAAVVAVAHRLSLDVPGDLTVAGFDDTALASSIWPELTTVHQPVAAMAETALQCLTDQIRAEREGVAGLPEHVVLAHSLVRRQSDAAPRVRPPTRAGKPA
jgi:LacI family transcriptional regulator